MGTGSGGRRARPEWGSCAKGPRAPEPLAAAAAQRLTRHRQAACGEDGGTPRHRASFIAAVRPELGALPAATAGMMASASLSLRPAVERRRQDGLEMRRRTRPLLA